MRTVTPAQFKTFGPCWLETAEGRERFRIVSALRPEWTALDVLALPYVSAQDKLWSVLREEFLPAAHLHEFACRCAEYALTFVKEHDSRSIEAIAAKRAWVRGEITDEELKAAREAAREAAGADAGAAAHVAARVAARAARAAVWEAAGAAALYAAWDVAWAAAWEHEADMLVELINEEVPAGSAIPDEHKANKPELILADGEGKVNA